MEAQQPPFSARAVSSLSLATDAGEATVQAACKLFRISRAAYYAARTGRKPKARPRPLPAAEVRPARFATAAELQQAIREVTKEHPAWGVRKVWATLRRPPYGLKAGLRRIWALMRELGLTFQPDRPARPEPARGHVAVPEPNRRWATDLTTVWTQQDGLVAVAPVLDCGDRSLLAIDATKTQDSPSVLQPVRTALEAEFGQPDAVPQGLELRTDHGSQYTGGDCEDLCAYWHLEHTLAPVGRPTGNAVAERFMRTLKEELIWLRDWSSLAELRQALQAYRVVYNEQRPHQALGWETPRERRNARLAASTLLAA